MQLRAESLMEAGTSPRGWQVHIIRDHQGKRRRRQQQAPRYRRQVLSQIATTQQSTAREASNVVYSD